MTVYDTETTTPLLGAASFTGVLGATFTATGTGTSLAVTSITGTLAPGDLLGVTTGVPANTTIVSQSSGPTGGNGTYITSQATTISASAATAKSNKLHASALTGTLFVGQVIGGSGVSGVPTILSQLTGTPGAAGVYVLSAQFQVASESMTGGAQTFTSGVHDLGASPTTFGSVGFSAVADQTGNLFLDVSTDGVTWHEAATAAMGANIIASVSAAVQFRYARCREVNNNTLQGSNLVTFGAF